MTYFVRATDDTVKDPFGTLVGSFTDTRDVSGLTLAQEAAYCAMATYDHITVFSDGQAAVPEPVGGWN